MNENLTGSSVDNAVDTLDIRFEASSNSLTAAYGITDGTSRLNEIALLRKIIGCHAVNPSGIVELLFRKFGDLPSILNARESSLMSIPGISAPIAHSIMAVQDAATRLQYAGLQTDRLVCNPTVLLKFLKVAISWRPYELICVMFLGSNNELISSEILTQNDEKHVMVSNRQVIRLAFEHRAVKVYIAHNHPSGDVTPSMDDVKRSRSLARALEYVEIELVDSIIVAKGKHWSFRELGYLDF